MKTIFGRYPVVAIVLLLLTCPRFEYHSSTGWSVFGPGLAGGLCVLGIIGIVLLFRIFNAVHDACISHGLLRTPIRSKYDLLIPIGIFVVAFHVRYAGEPFQGKLSNPKYRWEFEWSDPTFSAPFLAALIGIVLLVRILYLVRAIAENGKQKI